MTTTHNPQAHPLAYALAYALDTLKLDIASALSRLRMPSLVHLLDTMMPGMAKDTALPAPATHALMDGTRPGTLLKWHNLQARLSWLLDAMPKSTRSAQYADDVRKAYQLAAAYMLFVAPDRPDFDAVKHLTKEFCPPNRYALDDAAL